MNKLGVAVLTLVLLGSASTAAAQTATPPPTAPAVETEAPTAPPPVEEPAPATEDPVAPVAPVDTVDDDDDDDGLSTTAIALIILAAVVLLLLIYALAWGPWRRPGGPRPPA